MAYKEAWTEYQESGVTKIDSIHHVANIKYQSEFNYLPKAALERELTSIIKFVNLGRVEGDKLHAALGDETFDKVYNYLLTLVKTAIPLNEKKQPVTIPDSRYFIQKFEDVKNGKMKLDDFAKQFYFACKKSKENNKNRI